jgi:hypothetical protein
MMASKSKGLIVGGLVVAALMQAEHEAPGSTGRGAAELRNAVAPAASEAIGAAGDGVLIVRDELSRQGIDPTAVLQDPATTEDGAREGEGINGG